MRMQKRILVAACAMAVAAPLWAGGELESMADRRAIVLEEPDAIFIDGPVAPGLSGMIVRVMDAKGNIVLEERNEGGSMAIWAQDLPDGSYRYQIRSIFDRSLTEMSVEGDLEFSSTERGKFSVRDGVVIPAAAPKSLDDQASVNGHQGSWLARAAGEVLDWLVPAAHAQNVTVSSTNPILQFDDTDDTCCEWRMNTPSSGTSNTFFLIDLVGLNNHNVMSIYGDDGATLNSDSLEIDASGDIFLANDQYYFDRSTGSMAIGSTVTSGESLAIWSTNPEVVLRDESPADSIAEMENDGGQLRFKLQDGAGDTQSTVAAWDLAAPAGSLDINADGDVFMGGDVVSIGGPLPTPNTLGLNVDGSVKMYDGLTETQIGNIFGAFVIGMDDDGAGGDSQVFPFVIGPGDNGGAMFIDGTGNVGVGASTVNAPLHVQRVANAQVFVENTTGTGAARTLFKLANAGNTKFEIENTEIGNSWAFTNSGADFRVSLQGSGTIEFRIDNDGDAFLPGGTLTQGSDVNTKQNIVPIDSEDVLQRVIEMPVSKWEYKKAPGIEHIGPMAQDFYAAFGLGDTDKGISSIDSGGVALAAIQALADRNESLEAQNQQLQAQNLSLEQRLYELEAKADRITALEAAVEQLSQQVMQPVLTANSTH